MRLLSAIVRGDAVVSSGDEAHLSRGDDGDNADSVRIELCAVRLMAHDIVPGMCGAFALWRQVADFGISWSNVERSARVRCKKQGVIHSVHGAGRLFVLLVVMVFSQ